MSPRKAAGRAVRCPEGRFRGHSALDDREINHGCETGDFDGWQFDTVMQEVRWPVACPGLP